MFRLARRFCAPAPSGLAASVYAASPYLLFTAYERAAVGELLAAVWFPLLLGSLERRRLPVARTAVLLALLWYTNAPAGVMGSYLVLLALVFKAFAGLGKTRRFPARALAQAGRHLAALALGGLLAADYLLPAWYEQRFVAIGRAVGPGMRIRDSFLFGRTGEGFHDQVLSTASWIAVWTLGLGAAAGAFAVWRRPGGFRACSQRRAIDFFLLLLAVIFLLQLPMSGPVWRALPELEFLQFPWRLLLPGSAAVALLLALAASGARPRAKLEPTSQMRDVGNPMVVPAQSSMSAPSQNRPKRLLFKNPNLVLAGTALVLVAGLVGWASVTRYQPCDEEDNVGAQIALLASGSGFEGTDEYAAKDTDNGEIQQGLPPVRLLRSPDADEGDDSKSANPVWTPTPRDNAHGVVQVDRWGAAGAVVRVRPDAPAYAVLRLERFPSWLVLVNGSPCGALCVARDDGLLTVKLPARRWSTIRIAWQTTPDVRWGRGLSVCGLLLLLCVSRRAMMGRK